MAGGLRALASPPVRFGLLRYRGTENLGDEIQSLAARRFLPRVDDLIDRDAMDRRPCLWGRTHLIANSWLTHRPDRWPPHPNIEPLLVSVHLSAQAGLKGFSAAEALVVGRNARYLRDHGPVGARDLWTLDLLRRNGIESYFSGCLTLTLERPEGVVRGDYVVANDLAPEVMEAVQARTGARVITTTHYDAQTRGYRARMAKAEALISLYAGARAVVTSRLHCALPCLAMGTPVLLLPRFENSDRLTGLSDLVRHDTAAAFLAGRTDFELDRPGSNPDTWRQLSSALIERCSAFIAEAEDRPD